MRRTLAGALLLLLGTACSEWLTSKPGPGTIRVTVHTSGGDLDNDGFTLVVGSSVRRFIFGTAPILVGDLSPGEYSVSLEKVAENCSVSGANPRPVTVAAAETIDISFDVVCVATGIAVTVRTTGSDLPDNFQLEMNSFSVGVVSPNDSILVGRLSPGSQTIALMNTAKNCSVVGNNRVTVEVSARTVTAVRFEVTCVPPIRLEKIAFGLDTVIAGSVERWVGLVNVDGSGGERLARGDTPSWSSNGARLAYVTEDECDFYYSSYCVHDLRTADPETGNVRTLIKESQGINPAWNPKADMIAFSNCCDNTGSPARLFLFDLARASTDVITIRDVALARDPSWSPDGERIVFACVIPPGNFDLCVVARNGTGLVHLTSDDALDSDPAWSPDGKRIAFTRKAGKSQIAVITIDTRVVSTLADGADPSWSRDGSRLVFAGAGGLYTVNVDGSSLKRLTTGNHYAPAWRP